MSKIDKWFDNQKIISSDRYDVSESDINELIQIVRDECKPSWIAVNGYKDVPVGVWLVKLEKDLCGSHVQTMKQCGNVSVIASVFAFDAPRVTAYMEIPK